MKKTARIPLAHKTTGTVGINKPNIRPIPDMRAIFKRLGMSKHSAKLYADLQKYSPILTSNLVSKSRLHRPAVYKSLYELEKLGFIIKIKKGKRFVWQALDQQKILDQFSLQTKNVEKIILGTKPASGQTEGNRTHISPSMRILHGPEGIRAAFDDVIEHSDRCSTFYRYTSEQDLDAVNAYLSKDYRKKRDAKKLERKVISNPVSGRQKKPRLERFIKYIEPESDLFIQNIIQIIYKDRLALIDLNTEQAIIIENAALADFQKVIFRQLYKKL